MITPNVYQAADEAYGGPYDGVISWTLGKLLLPNDVPSAPGSYERIMAVQAEGQQLSGSVYDTTGSIDMVRANPLLDEGRTKIEQTQAAIHLSQTGMFTPNEVYRPGFNTVANCLVGIFEDEGLPSIPLAADRILETTDPRYVAYKIIDTKFQMESEAIDTTLTNDK